MTELHTFQTIVIAFGLTMIARTAWLFLRKRKSLRDVLLAIAIWGSVSLIGLFPGMIQKFGELLGFEVGANALLVISVIFLFFVALNLFVKIEKLNSEVTRLTRALSLQDLPKK